MNAKPTPLLSRRLNRRAFLYGLGGIGVGLPFLESVPDRSAWAADEHPTFTLLIGTGNGIIADAFWPSNLGPLTDLSSEVNATGILGDYAGHLLFVRGLRYPRLSTADGHGQSYPQMFTGAPYGDTGSPLRNATAASLDVILAPELNPDSRDPLTLYAGMKQEYINEALSWTDGGEVRSAQENPYAVYLALVGEPGAAAGPSNLTSAVLARRQSAVDLARDELLTFQGRTGLSQSDRNRLEQHVAGLRSIEQALDDVSVSTCSLDYLDTAGIDAAKDELRNPRMVEQMARLHIDLAAFAFACNIHRIATLQSGSGCDRSVYDVPSNARGWNFHHISHQIQSDSAVGNDPLAVQAHSEIDRLRMETLAHGIRQFDAHGLLDKALIVWTNQFSDGSSSAFSDLPYILAGNPYGRLGTGQYVDVNSALNGELLTTIARALGVDRLIGTATSGLDQLLA